MENQLEVIVRESGLEQTKAKYILERFQGFFAMADEWAQKAKNIKVTDPSQTAEMGMARIGRLFLRDNRLCIEKARKELKEQSLREGKAIDGIANVLKALIIPIEEYLDQQEHFVELKAKAEADERQREIERRMEEERLAKEKAEREEQERIRLENERFRKELEDKAKENEKLEAKNRAEREKAERDRISAQQKLADEIALREKEKAELKAKAESEKRIQEQLLIEQKAKAERERQKLEDKATREREKLEAEKKTRKGLEKQMKKLVECPFCHRKFSLENHEQTA